MDGGVGNKIGTQIRMWRELGNEVQLFLLTPDPVEFSQAEVYRFYQPSNMPFIKTIGKEFSRSRKLGELVRAVSGYKPDVIYLRYGLYTYPLQMLFDIAPVVLELNSNDLDEYRHRGRFFYWMNRLTRDILLGRSSGWVTASHEIGALSANQKFQKQYCVIANGIDLGKTLPVPAPHNEIPVITLVGSPGMNWHGVDKLIAFAKLAPDIQVNIVGYQEKDVGQRVPHNVKCFGFVDQDKVREILARSDVVCGTLALHRKNMTEASPLKVREALALGIPVILAYKDTDLDGLGMDTILYLPNTEENLMENQSAIKTFVRQMMGRRVNREALASRLSQYEKEKSRLAFFSNIQNL